MGNRPSIVSSRILRREVWQKFTECTTYIFGVAQLSQASGKLGEFWFLLGLFSDPEDGGSILLRKVCKLLPHIHGTTSKMATAI
jgi:hypothetical protein